MRKTLINLMCNFILDKEKRKSTRKKLLEQGKFESLSKKLNNIQSAVVDPKGMGMLSLMMDNANINDKYRFIFQKMREDDVCIDCGANEGLITDIMRFMNSTVHIFEPHPDLFTFLKKKYQNDDKVILYNKAVWDKEEELEFQIPSTAHAEYSSIIKGSTLFNNERFFMGYKRIKVPVIDLTEFIKKSILQQFEKVYFLKIDIEGAEFELIEKIIKTELYKNIQYVVCETHARFFKDGKQKLKKLNNLIEEKKITNIYLDWV